MVLPVRHGRRAVSTIAVSDVAIWDGADGFDRPLTSVHRRRELQRAAVAHPGERLFDLRDDRQREPGGQPRHQPRRLHHGSAADPALRQQPLAVVLERRGLRRVPRRLRLRSDLFFGPPVPVSGFLTTCVVNSFATDGNGTFDLSTGASTVSINLASRVFLTLGPQAPARSASAAPAPTVRTRARPAPPPTSA